MTPPPLLLCHPRLDPGSTVGKARAGRPEPRLKAGVTGVGWQRSIRFKTTRPVRLAVSQSAFEWVQKWYADNVDGDWEHLNGVEIATLDNPGWSLGIDIAETELSDRAFDCGDGREIGTGLGLCWRPRGEVRGLRPKATCRRCWRASSARPRSAPGRRRREAVPEDGKPWSRVPGPGNPIRDYPG